MAQYLNNFSQYTVGVQPSDWTKDGWLTNNATDITYTVQSSGSDKHLRISVTPTGTIYSDYFSWNPPSADANNGKFEILVKFRTSNPLQTFSVVGQTDPNASGKKTFAGITEGDDGQSIYSVVAQHDGNTYFNIPYGSVPYTYGANTWSWMRYRVDGTNSYFKYWLDGTDEPVAWNYTTPFTVNKQGIIGIATDEWYTSTIDVALFSVGTNGDKAPYETSVRDQTQTGRVQVQTPVPSAPDVSSVSGGFGGVLGWGGQGYAQVLRAAQSSVDQDQTGRLKVVIRQDRDQTGRLRIGQTVNKTQSGRLRITGQLSRTQTGRLRVRSTFDRTQSGRLDIKADILRPQTGRLTLAPSQSLPEIEGWSGGFGGVIPFGYTYGAFYLPSAVQITIRDRAQLGRLRVGSDTLRQQLGRLKINRLVTRNQLGRLRLQKTLDAEQTGRMAIQLTTLQEQAGRLRIYRLIDEDQTGVMSVALAVEQEQTGRMLVVEHKFGEQLGRMAIYNDTLTAGVYVLNSESSGTFEENSVDDGIYIPKAIQTGHF